MEEKEINNYNFFTGKIGGFKVHYFMEIVITWSAWG